MPLSSVHQLVENSDETFCIDNEVRITSAVATCLKHLTLPGPVRHLHAYS